MLGGVGADVVWCVEFKRVCVELGVDGRTRQHRASDPLHPMQGFNAPVI